MTDPYDQQVRELAAKVWAFEWPVPGRAVFRPSTNSDHPDDWVLLMVSPDGIARRFAVFPFGSRVTDKADALDLARSYLETPRPMEEFLDGRFERLDAGAS